MRPGGHMRPEVLQGQERGSQESEKSGKEHAGRDYQKVGRGWGERMTHM